MMHLEELRRQGSVVDCEKKKRSHRSTRSKSRTRSEGVVAITRTTSGIKSTRKSRSKSQTRSRGRSLTRSGSSLAGKSLTRTGSKVSDTRSRASSKVKSSTSSRVARREPSIGARSTGRARSRSITRTASSYSSGASSGISSSANSSNARSQFMSEDGILTRSLAAAASSSSDPSGEPKFRKKKNQSNILSRSKSIRLQKANPNVNSFVSTPETSSKSSEKKKKNKEKKKTKEMGRSIVKMKKSKQRSVQHLSEVICEEGNSVSLMSDWSSSVQSKKSKSVWKNKEDETTMSNNQGIGRQVSEEKSVKSKDSTDTKSVWSFMSKKSVASEKSMPKLSLVPPETPVDENHLEYNNMSAIKSQESNDTKSVFSFMSRKSNSSQKKETQPIAIKSQETNDTQSVFSFMSKKSNSSQEQKVQPIAIEIQESNDTKSVFSFMSRKSNSSQEKKVLEADKDMDVDENSHNVVGGIRSQESNDTKSSVWSFMSKKSEKLNSGVSDVNDENIKKSDSKIKHIGRVKDDDTSTLSSIGNLSYSSKKSATTSKSARSEKTFKTDNKNRSGTKVDDKILILEDNNTSQPKKKKSFFRKKKSMPTVKEEVVEENDENAREEDDSEVLYRAVLYLGQKADNLLTKGVDQAGANLTHIRDSAQCVS